MSAYQMSFDDYFEEDTKSLSLLTYRIMEYLADKHYGESTKHCPMPYLANLFNISERKARKEIEWISLNTPMVIGISSTGYYVASTEQEMIKANRVLIARVKSALKRIRSNGVSNMDWIYTYMNELNQEYPIHPEGQINTRCEIESYLNKKRLLAEQDK